MADSSITSAFFADTGPAGETVYSVYGHQRMDFLGRRTALYPHIVSSRNLEARLPELRNLDVIFSTWSMVPLSEAQLDQMPNLKAVFYAAGTVKYFAPPLLERGITVVSAWAANAVPVAEFTLGQILLSNKGYFRNRTEYQNGKEFLSAFRGLGNYGPTVSILGAGQVGQKLIELLRPFRLHLLAFDPFLTPKGAESLGVEKVETLDEAFARGDIVTNHLADVPQTIHLLGENHFRSMRTNATFINTGRGRTVDHTALHQALQQRPDLTALLDVTNPEPLPRDHPLRKLPNVHITSHIAGSIGNERERVADYALEEFEVWESGRPLRYIVTQQMLDCMA